MSIDRSRTRFWSLAVLVVVATAAAVLVIVLVRNSRHSPPLPEAPLRFALAPLDDLTIGAGPDYPFGLALAPDGRRIVFPAAKSGVIQLWIRDITTGTNQALPGTGEGVLPFWAPDGRAIGFFGSGRLRVFTLDDATVRDLAAAPSPRGGAWHPSGDIIFAPEAAGGLVRRRGSDGAIEPLTTPDPATAESSHRHPAFLDGGRHMIFFVRASEPTRRGIWIARLDQPANRKRLVGGESHGLIIDDALVYSSDGALVAQQVDVEAQARTGRSILLGTPVGRGPHDQLFATTAGDLLLYASPVSTLRELRWFDRTGAPLGVVGEPMEAWNVRIAPVGASVAVTRLDPQLITLDVWIYDGERPLPRRISTAIDVDESPVWAPDASRLAWVTGRRVVTTRGALAVLPEQPLRQFEHPVRVSDWSTDGQWIAGSTSRPGAREGLWFLPATGAGEPAAYTQPPFNEIQGAFSSDGRWMAYASDESGRFEIYIDSFPTRSQRARLTTGGGLDPRWRRLTSARGSEFGGQTDSELYFRRGTEVHAVIPINANGEPEAVSSQRLFDAGAEIRAYDVTGDGQRFLVNIPAAPTDPQRVTALVNVRRLLRFAQ